MFKKIFALFTLLAVLAAGMALPAGAALIEGENLLVNGNFESFQEDGTTPTGWTIVTETGHTVSVLQEEKSENHYLSLAGDYNKAYAKQVVTLPDNSAGAVYELSWKMKGGESNYSYIQVLFLNSAGQQLSQEQSTQQDETYYVHTQSGTTPYNTVNMQMNKDNNTSWRTYTHAFAVPVNVKYLELRAATRAAADKRPVDDFSLRRNDKAAFINYTYDIRMNSTNSMHDRNAAPNSNLAGEITTVEAVGKTGTDGVLFYDTTRTDGVKAAFGVANGTYDYYNAWVVPSKGNFVFSVDVYMKPTEESVQSAKLPMLLEYATRRYVTNGTAANVENDAKLEIKLFEGPDVKTGQWVTYQYPIPAAALEGEARRASLTIRNYNTAFAGQMYLDNIQIYREETSLTVTDSQGAAITSIPEDGKVNVKYRLVPSYGETNYSEGDILVCAYGENANGTKQLLSFDVLSPVSTDGLPVEATANLELSGHASLSEVRVFKTNALGSLQLTELLTLPKTAPAA